MTNSNKHDGLEKKNSLRPNEASDDQLNTQAGQAVYSPLSLAFYDVWVLGLTNHWIWQCPTAQIAAQFASCAGPRHVDIGVGTGYYLEHALPNAVKHLALVDLNRSSLDAASKRAKERGPVCYQRDVYQPLDLPEPAFDSVSINYLLHCLPGDLLDKAQALGHISACLSDEGMLFGSTVLGQGVRANWAAKKLMALYNRKGIFSNEQDTLEALDQVLNSLFEQVRIHVVGCVALFQAKNPIRHH